MRISQLIDVRPEWIEPAPIPGDSNWQELDSNRLVSAILYRRGLRTSEDVTAFMHPDSQPAPDPYRLPNMQAAVERIGAAIRDRERVGIFGDYDVDGVTSTAILTEALRVALGSERVIPRLPDRNEGYGLNATAIAEFREAGVSLVIAVDCGSSDHLAARSIAEAGMGLVICDHHQLSDSGPPEAITVSPQLNGDGTYHDLTAVGVVFLLVQAMAAMGIPVAASAGNDPGCYLDLVALGTVADVAPLTGVNRQLVARGVKVIQSGSRVGIKALIAVANLEPANITASSISFALAPRINSAGRIASPLLALNLMMTRDAMEARKLAQELEQVNFRRRSRSAQVLAEAYDLVTQRPDWQSQALIAVHHEGWEPGLVGAVASRMVEEVRRPVFLFREKDGVLTGSARSVNGFNLVSSMAGVKPLLMKFGGHSLAAGITLAKANLGQLEAHLDEAFRLTGLPIPAPRQLHIDAAVPPDYLTIETVREIGRMEPFGRGNDQPVLRIRDAQLQKYTVIGQDQSHLKIFARHGSRQIEALYWGAAYRSRELVGRRTIDLAGKLEINTWNGQDRLQMVLDDFHAG
jgi:single-stranded-DNA-specific exonuclease